MFIPEEFSELSVIEYAKKYEVTIQADGRVPAYHGLQWLDPTVPGDKATIIENLKRWPIAWWMAEHEDVFAFLSKMEEFQKSHPVRTMGYVQSFTKKAENIKVKQAVAKSGCGCNKRRRLTQMIPMDRRPGVLTDSTNTTTKQPSGGAGNDHISSQGADEDDENGFFSSPGDYKQCRAGRFAAGNRQRGGDGTTEGTGDPPATDKPTAVDSENEEEDKDEDTSSDSEAEDQESSDEESEIDEESADEDNDSESDAPSCKDNNPNSRNERSQSPDVLP